MNSTETKRILRFGKVLGKARELIALDREKFDSPTIVIVRDLYGRIRLALDGQPNDFHKKFAKSLHGHLGNYSPGADGIFLYKNDLLSPGAFFDSQDAIVLGEAPGLFLLERQLVNQDWLRASLPRPEPVIPRATLFGIKGGVGRSTALAVWAWHLARQGKKVLVVDLDLESPGLGRTMLPLEKYPDFGVVDWLVEDAVGQADEDLLTDLASSSPLSGDRGGEILVVPADGRDHGYYLAKLSRAYLETHGSTPGASLGERLGRMIHDLETRHQPDLTILDSRAGIHDISAVTLTRLGATGFLFAVNSTQTWHAYSLLFRHWMTSARPRELGANLKMVLALVPEMKDERYLPRGQESSYTLWSETLYEETAANDLEYFNFDLIDEAAPHYPLRTDWNRRFMEFSPVEQPDVLDPDQIQANYGIFLDGATRLLLGD